jgi:hypothetical protein
MQKEIASRSRAHAGGFLTIRRFRNGELLSVSDPIPNKVVSSEGYGRNLILRWMTGEATYPIVIETAALGDDGTAAVDGDTALGNETVADIPLTDSTVSGDELTIDVFVADANLPNGTYRELGFFADGRLMVRIVIDPDYTKVSGEDTLFTYTLALNG